MNGPRRAPPPQRPPWMVVLVALMLVLGARLLLSSLATFQALRAGGAVAAPVVDAPAGRDDEALARTFQGMVASFERAHPRLTTAHAGGRAIAALLLLFAVAAVLSSDPRGRAAAIAAALVCIAYNVGDALFLVAAVREGAPAAAPVLAQVLARRQGEHRMPPEDLTAFAGDFMLLIPVITAVLAIAFWVVVLVFFAGRRGRAFYASEHGA